VCAARLTDAKVPEPIAAEHMSAGKLMHVLEPFAPTAPRVFLYYPSRRRIMPKLRAFIDHVGAVRTPPTRLGFALTKGEPDL
jgi:DNA-binding transcriptional LysR family regulator